MLGPLAGYGVTQKVAKVQNFWLPVEQFFCLVKTVKKLVPQIDL
ncbi:hypothetical protein [Leptolyngbya sp. FACHB-541]|nr:hypothetical protein [Leptolyngbya sp. FACHB-541]